MLFRLSCLMAAFVATVVADIEVGDDGSVGTSDRARQLKAEARASLERAEAIQDLVEEVKQARDRLLHLPGGSEMSLVVGYVEGRRFFTRRPYIKRLVREEFACWDIFSTVYMPGYVYLASNGKLYSKYYGLGWPIILPRYSPEVVRFEDLVEVDLHGEGLPLGQALENIKALGR